MKLLLNADTHICKDMCAKGQDTTFVGFFFFFTMSYSKKKIWKAMIVDQLVYVLKNI